MPLRMYAKYMLQKWKLWLVIKEQMESDVLEVFSKEPAAIKYDGALGAAAITGAWNWRWLDVGIVLQLVVVAWQRPWDAWRRQLGRMFTAACNVVVIRVVVRSVLTLGSITVMMMMMMTMLLAHFRTDKAARYHMRYIALITWTSRHTSDRQALCTCIKVYFSAISVQ